MTLQQQNDMMRAALEKKPKASHGHSSRKPGRKVSPTYMSWQCMRDRCKRKDREGSHNYTARGIKVCERWHDISNFLADMGERPEGMTLDRINNDGDYEPGNVRWATNSEQARNKRTSKLTLEMAIEIAVLRLQGVQCKVIAAKYGVGKGLPREIVKSRCWVDALPAAKLIMEKAA